MKIDRWDIAEGIEDGLVYRPDSGSLVEYADHVATHEYDEVIELKKFFDVFGSEPAGVVWNQHGGIFITHFLADRLNFDYCNKWMGWKACAKSRAEA